MPRELKKGKRGAEMYERLLVALDHSESSTRALAVAKELRRGGKRGLDPSSEGA